jgi:hypothetical protein
MNEKEIIEIHADDIIGDGIGVAIICAPTGVFCTVQAGGQVCSHPRAEGYTITLHTFNKNEFLKAEAEFDDCAWGCHSSLIGLEEMNTEELGSASKVFDWSYREEYALDIDKFINDNLNEKLKEPMHFSFDYSRLNELMEGWWPVLIHFKKWPYFREEKEVYNTEFKGYLHLGNCD